MKGFAISVDNIDVPLVTVDGDEVFLGGSLISDGPITVLPVATISGYQEDTPSGALTAYVPSEVADLAEASSHPVIRFSDIYLRFPTLTGLVVGQLSVTKTAYEQTHDVLDAHTGIIYHSFWELGSGPALTLQTSGDPPTSELVAWAEQYSPDYAGAVTTLP